MEKKVYMSELDCVLAYLMGRIRLAKAQLGADKILLEECHAIVKEMELAILFVKGTKRDKN